MKLGVLGLLDSCGDPKAPTSPVPKRLPQAVSHVVFFICQPSLPDTLQCAWEESIE